MAVRKAEKDFAEYDAANDTEDFITNGHEPETPLDPNVEPVAGTNVFVYWNEKILRKMKTKTKTGEWMERLVPFLPWCPTVVKHFYIPGSSQESMHIYHIKVGEEVQEGTNNAVGKGLVWEKFSNLGGTNGWSNINILANVVKHQAKKVPLTAGYSSVGWVVVKDYATSFERYAYLLEDGRGLDGTEYYVERTTDAIIKQGKRFMPRLPLPEQDIETSESVLAWAYAASPEGHQVLSFAKQFRSYLDDIVPSLTSFFLYGAESDTRKNSALGKTTVELASHNLSFRRRYTDKAHASFQGTNNSVEKIVARQQSSNCLIDDFNIPPTATEKEVRDSIKIFDGIVRTNANSDIAKTRLNRDLTLAKGSEYHFLPGITGEVYPNSLPSIERRVISLPVRIGDIKLKPNGNDSPSYETDWEQTYAERLLRLGHMALREVERRRNTDDDLLRHEIEQYEKKSETRLFDDLRTELGREMSQLCQYLSKSYARLLTGMWALGKYAYDEEVGTRWADDIYPYVLTFLQAQTDRMDGFKKPEEKGSVTSLIHLIRDEISSEKRTGSQRYRIVDRKSRNIPDVTFNGEKIGPTFFGWASGEWKDEKQECVTFAFVDHNGVEPVLYPHPVFYQTLVERATRLDEYRSLRSVDAIKDALKAEGWLARTDESGKQDSRVVRLPDFPVGRHLELKLSHYIGSEILPVTPVTKLQSDVERPGERPGAVTGRDDDQLQTSYKSNGLGSGLSTPVTGVTGVTGENSSYESEYELP